MRQRRSIQVSSRSASLGLGYIHFLLFPRTQEAAMKVSDILRIRGNTLFTVQAGETLEAAIAVMAE